MEEKKPVDGNNEFKGEFGLSKRFALINRLITRDLNNYRNTPTFVRYTKEDISKYIANPYRFEKQLRKAVLYLYGASSHFRRLIQYFVGLSDLAYVVSPFKIDPKKANIETVNRNYRKVLAAMAAMHVKTQFPKILTVCLREDVYYGTMWVTQDDIIIQQLPSDYCQISTVEENVPNVTFDFSYFDIHPELLDFYPEEFRYKYEHVYKLNRLAKWIELDAPNSFAVKCNSDILDYPMPPFAGILRELFDIEDYKDLKLTKTALENYAMIVMKLGLTDEGEWQLDYKKAREFWENLDAILPEEIGSILSPMELSKISFERSNDGENDTVSESEQNLFTAAGVSSLLFNNPKASANALLLSIKADQMITFGIVKNLEEVVNRFLRHQSYGRYWKVTFLDVSPYNRKEMGDQYLKACEYGMPMISFYCASQGLGQAEIDSMSFLEGEVLELQKMFKPLRNSAQMSQTGTSTSDDGPGRPPVEDTDLTDSGEQSREDSDDW